MTVYTQSFGVGRFATEFAVFREPGWFARVVLRRKPKLVFLSDGAKRLASLARRTEEDLAREIFEASRFLEKL